MRDVLLEIVKYTGDLGFIDVIKVTDEKSSTRIEAINEDKSVVVNGEFKEPLNLFAGSFGMSDFSLIKGLCNSPTFKTDNSEIVVVKKIREESGKEVPVEILFKDNKGQRASYRLMDVSLLPKQAIFKGVEWDIEFEPFPSKISEFSSFSSLYNEKFFSVFSEDNNLKFAIGNNDGASNNITLNFVENVGNKLDTLYWPISEFLNIMKLLFEKENNVKIFISRKGVMLINVETPRAYWKYIMPSYRR